MKKFSLIMMLIFGMAASTFNPLLAADSCAPGNDLVNDVWCCVDIGDGSAQSCTSDNECWFCVGNCGPNDDITCIGGGKSLSP